MATERTDYTILFRRLAGFGSAAGDLNPALRDLFIDRAAFDAWAAALPRAAAPRRQRRCRARRAHEPRQPKFVLRNHLAQAAIAAARGRRLQRDRAPAESPGSAPSTNSPRHAAYAAFPPDWAPTRSRSPVHHEHKPRLRRPAQRSARPDAEWRAAARPAAVRGDAPRRHRARLHRQVLGPLGRTASTSASAAAHRCSRARTKFDAGCGWPSYDRPLRAELIERVVDRSHGMMRVEVRCMDCGAHLGHVFDDGPDRHRRALLHQLGFDRLRPAKRMTPRR